MTRFLLQLHNLSTFIASTWISVVSEFSLLSLILLFTDCRFQLNQTWVQSLLTQTKHFMLWLLHIQTATVAHFYDFHLQNRFIHRLGLSVSLRNVYQSFTPSIKMHKIVNWLLQTTIFFCLLFCCFIERRMWCELDRASRSQCGHILLPCVHVIRLKSWRQPASRFQVVRLINFISL